ncbi:MAG: hypothetical protein V1928_05645 [Parcubacteria group bacterium]
MPFNFLKHFYHHVRGTLIWFVVYFFLHAIIWSTLGVLIWLYPQALFVLASLFFFIITIVSLYFAILFIRYALKLKKIKDLLSGDWS